MLSRRTMRRPWTGSFQMLVCTVLAFQRMSRGSPTFTDSKRAIAIPPFRAGDIAPGACGRNDVASGRPSAPVDAGVAVVKEEVAMTSRAADLQRPGTHEASRLVAGATRGRRCHPT